MDVAAVVVGGLVAVLAGSLSWARGRRDGERQPLFVTRDRCPVCDHAFADHHRGRRLSDVRQGCGVSSCECDVEITSIPGVH